MARSRHPRIPACQEDMIRTRASREAHFHSNDSTVRTFSQPAFFIRMICSVIDVDVYLPLCYTPTCSLALPVCAHSARPTLPPPLGPRCCPFREIQSVFAASGFFGLHLSSILLWETPSQPCETPSQPAFHVRTIGLVRARRLLSPRALLRTGSLSE
jgi:hypothetical protein